MIYLRPISRGISSIRYWYSARCYNKSAIVLGLESSCDDTGAAVVTDRGEILGEALHNQSKMHRQFGGIIPTIARDLHQDNVERIVSNALDQAQMSIQEVDALAVTVKPGLTLSLMVGLRHMQKLAAAARKPIIPIHHMEAHALTPRLTNNVDFPYMVLLMSGGHCLLAVVHDIDKYSLLGTQIDNSPGDMLDKTARRLRLRTIPELEEMCGGAAIEHLARYGDCTRFAFPGIMLQKRDCNFSFSGLQFHAKQLIEEQEKELGVMAGRVIPNVADLCASLQLATLQHMAKRLYRGFMFADMKEMLPSNNRTLVVSGGVASNAYYRAGLAAICEQFDCKLVCPPARLCTDNGVMIAWNGIEKWMRGLDILDNTDDLKVEHRCPLGETYYDEVAEAGLKVPSKIFTSEQLENFSECRLNLNKNDQSH